MNRHPVPSDDAERAGSDRSELPPRRLSFVSLLFVSAWAGLIAGLIEVAAIIICKEFFDPNQLYGMTRHFVWLIPLINLGIFVGVGLIGEVVRLASKSRGDRVLGIILGALVVLPGLLVAFPRIYSVAWLVIALALGVQFVPVIETNGRLFRQVVRVTYPIVLGIVAILGASPFLAAWRKQSHENARTLPPPGSPNLLFIVLDTVAARHLSLYGYQRATSTSLSELAAHAIQFEKARSAASWTLPSHATMFTGRWMHELSVGWLTPLDARYPTLAEWLSDQGYATAGFVANSTYAGMDSGLARGFTRYEDYYLPRLTALKTAVMIDRSLKAIQTAADSLDHWPDPFGWRAPIQELLGTFLSDRKPAAVVNRELLDWLSQRAQPDRPFFAFLNFMDAHYPYFVPEGRLHRFGGKPVAKGQRALIRNWADLDKNVLDSQDVAFAGDAYDDCVADLDEQFGKLIDKLRKRGVLDRTWLIVVADHGESFGEHTGIFCHGSSLYQTELHVPLLIVPPRGRPARLVVKDSVTLRDLPATIVDVLGVAATAPFPGQSLTRHWVETFSADNEPSSERTFALAEVVPDDPRYRDSAGLPQKTWPLGALTDNEWSYIRREGSVREELFHLREDALEHRNLAAVPAERSRLERMRQALSQMTGGPLLPKRFNR